MKRMRTRTERQLDDKQEIESILKAPVKASAKYWFSRKPYTGFDLRRGDAGGQENIESVSSVTERNTKIEEGYSEIDR